MFSSKWRPRCADHITKSTDRKLFCLFLCSIEMLPPYCAAQCHIFPSIKTLEPRWICCPMVWLVMAVPRLKLYNYNTNIGAKLRRLRRLTHDSVWGDLDGSVSGGEQACVLLVKISHHPRTWHVLRANSSLNL